jgi:formylglycine-generating enzyme required for sulfatase activity
MGLTLGLGCSAVVGLSLLTFGLVNLGEPEPEVVVQAAPTLTAAPTQDVQATAQQIAAVMAAEMAAGTLTAQPAPATVVQVAPPTATPTTEPVVAEVTADTADDSNVGVSPETTESIDGVDTQPLEAEDETTTTEDDETDDPSEVSAAAVEGAEAAVNPEPNTPANIPGLAASTLVEIDGATFAMGTTSEEIAAAVRECETYGSTCQAEWATDSLPQHDVTLDNYQIEQREVTKAQYVAFLNWMGPGSHADGCFGQPCVAVAPDSDISSITFDSQNYDFGAPGIQELPITGVTWYGARAYCEAIGRRLPTEAEWEYAAKGPDGSRFPWGDTLIIENSRNSRQRIDNVTDIGPVDVGNFAPAGNTPTGLQDMAGNVEEWVFDWYDPTFYSTAQAGGSNPTGPDIGSQKVLRGGSWDQVPFFVRTVHRRTAAPNETLPTVGFRCADDPDQELQVPDQGPSGALTGEITEEPLEQEEDLNAAPTLEPIQLPDTPVPSDDATDVPAVPPGG